jgi:RNA polymerase sigma-70 factor (ECF subfamily)
VAEAHADLRPLLFSIAYRMLGSVVEAEDMVQEAYLRYQRAVGDHAEVEDPKSYLCAVVTRLCIDHLRSARVRRESYVGPWMPEPLLTEAAVPDGARIVEDADSVSMAFLLVLERLKPVERAVFLLHDVFDYGYGEVAEIVGRSEDNCRQLAVRARRHVREERRRAETSADRRQALADRFFEAVHDGDLEGLVELLAEDVAVVGDHGGVSPSWPRPIVGRDRVVPLLAGLARQTRRAGLVMRRTEINGAPGALVVDAEGAIFYAVVLDVAPGGVIEAVRTVRNPAKLAHLGPVGDVRALLGSRGAGREG